MSRISRNIQPPGGQSSISLCWNEHRQQHEQRHHSARATRRGHEADRSCEGEGRLSSRARHTTSRQHDSHRREDVQKAPPHHSARHSRHPSAHSGAMTSRSAKPAFSSREDASAMPSSARASDHKSRSVNAQRKMDSGAHGASRSVPHFGPTAGTDQRHTGRSAAGSRSKDADWAAAASRARYAGRESQPSRTFPGEELHSPMYNSWMDPPCNEPLPTFMPLSSRSNPQQPAGSSVRRRSGERLESRNDESGARCSTQRPRTHEGKYSKHGVLSEKDVVKSRKNLAFGPHHWSMGSSVATSAQGSVIDSCPSDLWETSSVDSLPLGAEWFNFMHGRR